MLEPFTDEQRQQMWRYFGCSQKSYDEDRESIKEWMEKQPHLPEIPSAKKIGAFLVTNKLRMQQTKRKLDNYYTVRTKETEMFSLINPNRQQMKDFMDITYSIPLPKLTKELYRVLLLKLNCADPAKFDRVLFFGQALNVTELRLLEDTCLGNIIIADLENFGLGHVVQLDPMFLKKTSDIIDKCYSSSNKGVHLINVHPAVEKFLNIFKSLIPKKMSEKFFVHSKIETLHEHVSPKILPLDYGGTEKSMKELNEIIKRKLWEYREYFDRLDTLKVEEHLRPRQADRDQCEQELQGNFRKLEVD